MILSDSPEGFLFIKLTRKENIEWFRLWRSHQIPASAMVNLIREGKEFHMIPKAFVLHLFLVSPLNSLVLLTLDLCLTYMSANSNSFCNLKKEKLSWVLIKVQPTCKAFASLKLVTWKEVLDLLRSHARRSGILLPIYKVNFGLHRVLINFLRLTKFPWSPVSDCQHKGTFGLFSEWCADISISWHQMNHLSCCVMDRLVFWVLCP